MVRGYAIYFGMFVALIVGLWAVLTVGSRLQAPDDLSGEWQVTWATRPPTGGQEPEGTMHVQQSGRFFNVTFDDALRIKLKMADGTVAIADAGAAKPSARLVGDPWTLSVHRISPSDELALELTGPGRFQGVARRPVGAAARDSLSADAAASAEQSSDGHAGTAPPSAPAPTAATHARP